MPVADLEQAIELANASPYGLGANVYTRDLETAIRCARELRAGTVWINDPLTDSAGPFGGMKRSGSGRELGQEGSTPSRRPSTSIGPSSRSRTGGTHGS